MGEADVLADVDRALAATKAVVAGIGPSQWTAPTPCTGLDVRGVLNHRVSGNLLESVYTAPFGTAPGAVLAHVRIVELLAHGWDLARATGQATDFPGDVAERALAAARQQLATRPVGPGAPFAREVPVPAGAPAVDRLAGFLGRPV